ENMVEISSDKTADSPVGGGIVDPVDVRLPTPTPSEFKAPSLTSFDDSNNSGLRGLATSTPHNDTSAMTSHPLEIAQPQSEVSTPAIAVSGGDVIEESLTSERREGEFGQETNRGRNRGQTSGQSSQRSWSIRDLNATTPPPAVREFIPISPRLSQQRRTRSPSHSRSSTPSLNLHMPPPPRRDRPRPPITARIRQALGIATPKASLVWRLGFGIAQVAVISTLLGLASRPGSAHAIPNEIDGLARVYGQSQWETCQRPLGAWDVVWAVKAAIGMAIAVWEYRRAVRP
ncbi:hypothetical protein FRC07_013123, partial [Ceratobasidium sp. 392]